MKILLGIFIDILKHLFSLIRKHNMSVLVSLKSTRVQQLNLLQLSDDYALSIFVSNLKPDISKSIRLFNPNTLTQALNLATQIESLAYNIPMKPFVPYKQPITHSSPYPNTHLSPKSSYNTNFIACQGYCLNPIFPLIHTVTFSDLQTIHILN